MMIEAYAHPIVLAAIERLERIESCAYAVESQNLSARAKLARIRLLRREARTVVKNLKSQLENQRTLRLSMPRITLQHTPTR